MVVDGDLHALEVVVELVQVEGVELLPWHLARVSKLGVDDVKDFSDSS